MKPKFSPGPWKVYHERGPTGEFDSSFIRSESGALICEQIYAQKDDNPEWSSVPNAALIAAAPELWELAEALNAILETLQNVAVKNLGGKYQDQDAFELKSIKAKIERTLKKARGDS